MLIIKHKSVKLCSMMLDSAADADACAHGGCRQFTTCTEMWHTTAESERELKAATSPCHSPVHSNHVFFSLHPSGDDTNCRTYVRKVRALIDFKCHRHP